MKKSLASFGFLLFLISSCKQETSISEPQAIFSSGLEDKYLAPYGCPQFLVRRSLEELQKSSWSFGSLNVHESCQNRAKTAFASGAELERYVENLEPLKLGNSPGSVSACLKELDKSLPTDTNKKNMITRAVVSDYYYTMNKISHGVTGTLEAIANLDILLGQNIPLPQVGTTSKQLTYADKYVPRSSVWVKELGDASTCRKEKVAIPSGSPFCHGKVEGENSDGSNICFVEPFELLLEQSRIVFRALAKLSIEIGKVEKRIVDNSVSQYLTRYRIIDRAYVMDGYGARPSSQSRKFASEVEMAIASLEAALKDLTSKSNDTGFDQKNRAVVEFRVNAAKQLMKTRQNLLEQYRAWTSTVPWLKMDGYNSSNFMEVIYRYGFWEHYLFNLPEKFDVKNYYYNRHAKPFSYKDDNGNQQTIDISKVDTSSKAFLSRVGVAADMAVREKLFTDKVKSQLAKNRSATFEKLMKYYKAARCIHNRSDAFFDKPIVSALSDKCKTTVTEVLAELPEVYADQANNKNVNDDAFFQDVAYTNPDFLKDTKSGEAVYNRLSVANELSQAKCRTDIRDNNTVINDVRSNMIFALAFSGVGLLQGTKFAPVIMSQYAAEYAEALKITGDAYVKFLRTTAANARAASLVARTELYIKALQQTRNALNFSKILAVANGTVAAIDVAGAVRICESLLKETMVKSDRELVDQLLRPNLISHPTCPSTPELFSEKIGKSGEVRLLPIKAQRALIANAESGMNQCLLTFGMSVVLNSVQALDDVYRISTASSTIQKLKSFHR